MILVPAGIETENWVKPRNAKGFYRANITSPKGAADLFALWHKTVKVSDSYKLGDLFNLLRNLDPGAQELVGVTCDMDLPAFLEESLKPSSRSEEVDPGETKIEFLVVSNSAEYTQYEEDPARPDTNMRFASPDDDEVAQIDEAAEALSHLTGDRERKAFIAPSESGGEAERIILPELNGKWVGPYKLSRDFGGWGPIGEPWGGAIASGDWEAGATGAISPAFMAVSELAGLSLRYDPRIAFYGDIHTRLKDDPQAIAKPLFEDGISITLGEFVHAVLWEIGWYGAPEQRDARASELGERLDGLEGTEPDE